jgi:hypothetical protein
MVATSGGGEGAVSAFRSGVRALVGAIVCSFALVLSCNAPLKPFSDIETVQRELQRILTAEAVALSEKNLDEAYKSYSPDWELLDADGTRLSLVDERRLTQKFFDLLTSFRGSTVVEATTLRNGEALTRDRSQGEMDLLHPQTGRRTTLRYEMTREIVWRYSGGKWLIYRTHVVSRQRWLG